MQKCNVRLKVTNTNLSDKNLRKLLFSLNCCQVDQRYVCIPGQHIISG